MVDAVVRAVAILAVAVAVPLGAMTTPDDMERARRIKWQEEGFDHEAELPPLPTWAFLLFVGGLGTLFMVVWPFAQAGRLWTWAVRRCWWHRRPR